MAPEVRKKIKSTVVEDHHMQHVEKKQRTNTTIIAASGDSTRFSEHSTISKSKLHVPPSPKDRKIKSIVVVPDHRRMSDQEDEKDHGIHLGISSDRVNLGSKKKKLLVIPLRGIFVHRAHRWWPETIPRNSQPDFCYGHFLVYVRPYCVDFLKFCFKRFNVGLWSSAREKNLQGILDNIIGDLKDKFLFTWDKKHCTYSGFKCLGKKDKPLFLKEPSFLWEKKYPNLPWSDGEYSASNTLLFTHPEKALLNPPNTAIFPPSYDPENKKDDLLGPNGALRVFLSGLAEAEDVQTYVKDHPIGDPEITPSHPDWDHYCKIVCSINKKRFGKQITKKEENAVAANKKDTKQKVKIVESEKDDSMSEDEDDEGFDIEDDSDEEEETLQKQQSGKKRPNESAIKTPANEKKAKMSTPQKIDGKRDRVHVVATPHSSKQGKTPTNKSCNRNFKSDMALQSHNQGKHK